jgi:hypothetical protein
MLEALKVRPIGELCAEHHPGPVVPLEHVPLRWNIAGVGEVVGAFGRGDGVEGVAERVPQRPRRCTWRRL